MTRFHSSSRGHVTPLLQDRHWLPIRQRVQYKLCMLVNRCLYGEAPSYLAEFVVPTAISNNKAGLRSAQSLSIIVPHTHPTLAFSVAAPRAWNNFPPHIRHIPSMDVFSKTRNLSCFHVHSNCHVFEFLYVFIHLFGALLCFASFTAPYSLLS